MRWTNFKNAAKRMIEKICDPKGGPIREKWNVVFAASCLLAVLTDPFFLYVSVINQDLKCIRLDNNLKIAALIFRSITDLIYTSNIIFQIQHERRVSQIFGIYMLNLVEATIMAIRKSYILLDFVAVLPIPQVSILVFFTKMRGRRSLNTRKFLNFLVMLQYVPRVFRIYLAGKEVKDPPNRKLGLWIKGGLNLLMYIVACHIMGGLWYFFSVQRMIACWQYACHNEAGCKLVTLECHDLRTNDNVVKLLNEACPINPSDETIFNFGIYLDALQSGLVESTDFWQKFSNCLWWGLRNLSSLGSNLQPSINTWENFFAALTSVIGLLLFLYLIGKVQMYMQVESGSIEQLRYKTERMKEIEERKGSEVEEWLVVNHLPDRFKTEIMKWVVQVELVKNKEFDIKNVESILPIQLQKNINACKGIGLWMSKNGIPRSFERDIVNAFGAELEKDDVRTDFETFISVYSEIQVYLPYNRLKKLKVLKILGESVLKAMCDCLKPVEYKVTSKITEEDKPLEFILFVEGTVVGLDGKSRKAPLVWGEELLLWPSSTSFPAVKPVANDELWSFGRVTGLVLSAEDLESIVSRLRPQFDLLTSHWMTRLKNVPKLQFMDEQVLRALFVHLKQDWAPEYGYVEGKPVASMNFIIEGSVKFTREDDDSEQLVRHEGQVYGEELLDWVLDKSFPTLTPLATHTAVYDDDEVVQLYITAEELKIVADEFSSYFTTLRKESQPDLKTFVGMTLLKRVSKFKTLPQQVLEAICQKLQVRYSVFIEQGDPVDKMVFVVKGYLRLFELGGGWVDEYSWFGEELIDWLATTSDGTRPSLSAYYQVVGSSLGNNQYLVITADDLEIVISNFKSHFM